MMGYGVAFWLPSLLQRSFALDLVQTSHFIGAVLLLGGVAGMLLGGWLGDRLGTRDRAYFAWVPALAGVRLLRRPRRRRPATTSRAAA